MKVRDAKHYNIKHITGRPHNPTGQAVAGRSIQTLKDMLHKEKAMINTYMNMLHNTLLTLNFHNAYEKGIAATGRHWIIEKNSELNQSVYF